MTNTPIESKVYTDHNEHASSDKESVIAVSPNADIDEETPHISWKTWVAILALSAMFNCGLSMYILSSSIQGYINEAVGPNPDFAWISSGKTVATASVGVLAGTISDLFGRRFIIIGGSLLGIVGCVVGATAQSVEQVIGAMVIMGTVSGAGYNSMACACELVAKKQRGMVMSIMSLTTLPFSCFGSLIANSMVTSAGGFRSIFYLGIGICSLSTVLNFFFYQPGQLLAAHGRTKCQILADFDWVGFAGITAGPTLFLIGVIWAGGRYEFASAPVLSTFISGIVICIALGFYEVYWAKQPILHPKLFKRVRTYTLLLVVTFTGGTLFYSMTAIVPLLLRLVFAGDDPIKIGLYGLPLGMFTTIGGIIMGTLAPVIGHTRLSLTLGVVIQLLSIGLLAYPNTSQVALVLVFTGIGGFTIGWVQVTCNVLVQLSMPDELIGFATGIAASIRLLGGSIGIAVYTTIYRKEAAKLLPGRMSRALLAAGLPQTSLRDFLAAFLGGQGKTLASLPGVTPDILSVAEATAKETYLDAFKPVWYAAVGIGATALIAAIFTEDMSDKFTNEITQTLQTGKKAHDIDEKA